MSAFLVDSLGFLHAAGLRSVQTLVKVWAGERSQEIERQDTQVSRDSFWSSGVVPDGCVLASRERPDAPADVRDSPG
jgi:hypothetical protein